MDTQVLPAQAARTTDDRLVRLLGYANPYAQSADLLPPVGRADALDPARVAQYRHIFESLGHDPAQFDMAALLARDPSPIPHPANREGYNGDHHLAYWLTGYLLFRQVSDLAARYGVTGGHYMDFGGSTGRVFRHFGFQSDAWQVWSCDFKASSVQWNLTHFPRHFRCFQNMYFPFLPVEDRQFSVISAFSVFTHIDETETMWLMELRRCLRPGGLALLTVHNEASWRAMPDDLRGKLRKYRPDIADLAELPEGRHVSTWRHDDPYRCDVFHTSAYLRANWGRYFVVEEILSGFVGFQSMVVLRRTDAT